MTIAMTTHIFPRVLDLSAILEEKSYFLLGPRQTGKSTLISQSKFDGPIFDLNNEVDFFRIGQNPENLSSFITDDVKVVVIDEIQRASNVLNHVHHLIETRGVHFLLTGSSARKLRQGGVNLLGGRARILHFHPLLKRELGDSFKLERALEFGTIPSIYSSSNPRLDLEAYLGTYLRQEILAEGFVRNLQPFRRVLDIAALCNATIVNFTNIANDAQVPRTTVYEYFDLLCDTLIVYELPAWRRSRFRKPVVASKYYFFDIGVAGALQRSVGRGFASLERGQAFETWFLHELRAWIDYNQRDETLHHWRSQTGFEVDVLLGEHTAIELKAKKWVTGADLKGLQALREEESFKNYLCVCLEERPRQLDGIEILPYETFLDALWQYRYCGD
ncbi:MAG: ATP-binding protein [Gammaproteobacteria bacterium]|nr:ATP-binding protein [Gammaproteobacteria bacterium]MYI76261.1 ATP-binding protein [Gammaproteobacteria bacterium]